MLYLKAIKRVYNPFSNTAKAIPPILEGKDVLASARNKQQDSPYPLQTLSQGKHLSHLFVP
jgi:hypothetical protein